jgi:hypothetical protein
MILKMHLTRIYFDGSDNNFCRYTKKHVRLREQVLNQRNNLYKLLKHKQNVKNRWKMDHDYKRYMHKFSRLRIRSQQCPPCLHF